MQLVADRHVSSPRASSLPGLTGLTRALIGNIESKCDGLPGQAR
jgi:hypothetical protein